MTGFEASRVQQSRPSAEFNVPGKSASKRPRRSEVAWSMNDRCQPIVVVPTPTHSVLIFALGSSWTVAMSLHNKYLQARPLRPATYCQCHCRARHSRTRSQTTRAPLRRRQERKVSPSRDEQVALVETGF